jgi:hypothetical protein
MTFEIKSITEPLTKLHAFCLETHQKAPKKFVLGREEYCRFIEETGDPLSHRFWDIEVEMSDRPGIDLRLH